MNPFIIDTQGITFILAALPSIILFCLYFFYLKDHQVNFATLIKIYLAGIFIGFPAQTFNGLIEANFQNGDPINDSLLKGFFAGGLVEELLKFSVLYFLVLKTNSFNKQIEAIFFGMAVSVGFATIENFGYVYDMHYKTITSFDVAYARSYTAVVMHSLNGIIMGFYFSFYAIKKDKRFLGFCIILPILFHGTYNFLVDLNYYAGLSVLIIMLILVIKFYKNFKEIIS